MTKLLFATILSIVALTVSTFAEGQSEPISLERDGPRFGFNIYTGDIVYRSAGWERVYAIYDHIRLAV